VFAQVFASMVSPTLSCGLSALRCRAVCESWAEVGRGHATKSTGPEQAAQEARLTTMFTIDFSSYLDNSRQHTV